MTRITDEAVWVASRTYNEFARTRPSHPDAMAAALEAALPYLGGVDELEEALGEIRGLSDQPHRSHGFDAGCPVCKGSPKEIASALAFAEALATIPHLTDDGVVSPPADPTGAATPTAAESATVKAAPSSPHLEGATPAIDRKQIMAALYEQGAYCGDCDFESAYVTADGFTVECGNCERVLGTYADAVLALIGGAR